MAKLKLIPNWKKAWRFASVRLALLQTALSIGYQFWGDIRLLLQPFVSAKTLAALGVLFIVFRLIDQSKNGRD